MAANISSLQKGLVAHYPLNGEYETKDATPYANHGTNNGATLSTGRKGEANGSYVFDGVNDYINLNKPLLNNTSFTISFWINHKGFIPANRGTIISQYAQSREGRFLYWFDKGQLKIAGQADSNLVNPPLTDGWYLTTIIYENQKFNVYFNNDKVISDISFSPIYQGINTYLGGVYDTFFNGSMSDVRIYNRALEEDEIKLLYDSFKPEIATSDLNKGLVGHWMLDSENGAKDLTPNGNNGTANGGVTIGGTTDRKGRSGGATSFDGSDDKIQANILSNIPVGNEDRTLSAWIKQSSGGKGDMKPAIWIGSEYTHNITAIGVRTSTNKLGMTFWADELDSNITATIGEWFLLTGSYNGTTRLASLYINGILAKSKTLTTDLTTTEYVSIGKEPLGTRAFSGSIQEARIYNRALSADEIKLLYDQYKPKEASIGSLQKGLILDMPLTTKHMKSATVVSDRTPYGNDGTVSGATVGSEYTNFDGVDDYVEVVNNESLQIINDLTLSLWVNFYENKQQFLIHKYYAAEFALDLYSTNRLVFYQGNGSTYNVVDFLPTLQTEEWYHLLVTRRWDESNNNWEIKFYLNGEDRKTGSISINPIASSKDISFGEFQGSRWFDGLMSGVKIYNRALSAAEVKLLYEKGRY